MNPKEAPRYEALLGKIGQQVFDESDGAERIFMYAKVERGAISVGAFAFVGPKKPLKYTNPSDHLIDLCYELWEMMDREKQHWALMCYNLDGERMSIDFLRKTEFDAKKQEMALRDELLQKYLNTNDVNYNT